MSWRDSLRPASYRGVPFYISSADTEIGRRTVTWEYPLRDEPGGADLGRRARKYKVEAFVLGRDYMSARDALRAAIEEPGDGELVHPFLGTVAVRLDGAVRVHESTSEGGWAQFSLSFVEAGQEVGPRAVVDTATVLIRLVGLPETQLEAVSAPLELEGAAAAVADEFAEEFDATGLTSEQRQGLAAVILESLSAAASGVRSSGGLALGLADQGVAELGKLQNDMGDLLGQPRSLAARTIQLMASIFAVGEAVPAGSGTPTSGALRAWRGAFEGESQEGVLPPPGTAVGQRLERSALATEKLTASAATLAFAVTAAQMEWESHGEAIAARDEVSEAIRVLEAYATTDPAYEGLRAVRSALSAHLSAVAGGLPRVTRLSLQASVPALVLAHRLYGDASRSDEIVRRNKLSHPGFVPANRELEVLSG